MRKKALFFIAAALVLTTLQGCTYIAQFLSLVPEKPNVYLRDVKIESANFSRVQTKIILDLENKGLNPLQLFNINYELLLDDVVVGDGTLNDGLNIAPNDTQTISIPLAIKPTNALVSLLNVAQEGHLPNARVKGDIAFGTWLGTLVLPFDKVISKPEAR